VIVRKNRRLIIGAVLALTLAIPMGATPSAFADSASVNEKKELAQELAAAKQSAALGECPADPSRRPARCMKTTVTPKVKNVAQPADRAVRSRIVARKPYDTRAVAADPDCSQGYDRFLSCGGTINNYEVIETVNGVSRVVGRVDFTVDDAIAWDSFSLNWTHKATIANISAWGTELAGPEAQLSFGCDKDPLVCERLDGPASEIIRLENGLSFTRTYTYKDTGTPAQFLDATEFLVGYLGTVLRVTPIGAPNQLVFDDGEYNEVNGRCDSEQRLGGRGCINPASWGYVVYDSRSYPKVTEVAQHIYDAQDFLPSKWGRPTAGGKIVTRTYSQAKINANRAVACGGGPVDGDSCDEFSLASTNQGAAQVAPGDWSARGVSLSSNQSQGGLTGAYYSAYRISDEDPFWILAILPDGRDSWR
jgi:hypothetical protein